MKILKLVLSIIVIVFAILGLTRIISFDIANPIMLFALATLLLLRSVEYKRSRDDSGFILTIITSAFVYIVIIYNLFLS
ncbi:hypothetical protein NDGK_02107 [Clostridiales bacterium CHKCI001]|nr:hypothetical protein NDGK_02107 [Clostridiales bacterium CHKCI001]